MDYYTVPVSLIGEVLAEAVLDGFGWNVCMERSKRKAQTILEFIALTSCNSAYLMSDGMQYSMEGRIPVNFSCESACDLAHDCLSDFIYILLLKTK